MKMWRCRDCGWTGSADKMLHGVHPFRETECVNECPDCFDMENFELLCDVKGCNKEANCGWPSENGYRNTCHNHSDFETDE
jgi:hypothetical protein